MDRDYPLTLRLKRCFGLGPAVATFVRGAGLIPRDRWCNGYVGDNMDVRNKPFDSDEGITVIDEPARARYEARVGGTLAGFADYRRVGHGITFPHTVVERPFRGRGLAGRMAAMALAAARDEGLLVSPQCSFFADYIARHPEYRAIVDPAYELADSDDN